MHGQLQHALLQGDDTGRRHELALDLLAAGAGVEAGQPHWHVHTASFLTRPSILRRLASELAKFVGPDVDRLAGRTAHLLAAVGLATGLPFAIVRPQSPDGATAAGTDSDSIGDGEIHADEHVLVIEDVIRTGTTAVRTANAIRAAGARVDTVACVLDLGHGGARAVAAEGYRMRPVLAAADLPPRPRTGSGPDDDLAAAGLTGGGQAELRFDSLADSGRTKRLGRALADRLEDRGITHLLVWERPDDLVLAYVMAEQMGLPVLRLESVAGVLYLSGALPPTARVAIVAHAFQSTRDLLPLPDLLAHNGAHLVAAAGLVRTPVVAAALADRISTAFLLDPEASV